MSPSGCSSTGVADSWRDHGLPGGQGHGAQAKLAFSRTPRFGFDPTSPTHDDDGPSFVLGGVCRKKARQLFIHGERPGSPDPPLGHGSRGVVRQRRAEDDVGPQMPGHRFGGILVAAQKLRHEVFLRRVRAGGLEGIPLERDQRGHVEGLDRLANEAAHGRFAAPGGRGEVDGLGGAEFGRESGGAKRP
jgi:hypothetical protein